MQPKKKGRRCEIRGACILAATLFVGRNQTNAVRDSNQIRQQLGQIGLTAFCGEEADPWFEANWEWQKGI
jgi:hypothetical protein